MQAIAQGNPGNGCSTSHALDTSFREELRRRLRTEYGFAIGELRKQDAFRPLGLGPWAVFKFIAESWRTNPDAWPSQVTIGEHVGADQRTVRTWLEPLLLGGFLVVRRERVWRQGMRVECLHYAPGPATLAGLEAWAAAWPKGEADGTRRPKLRRFDGGGLAESWIRQAAGSWIRRTRKAGRLNFFAR